MTTFGSSAKVKWDRPKDRLDPARMDKNLLAILDKVIEVRHAWEDAVDGGTWSPRTDFNGPGSGLAQQRPTEAAVFSPTRRQLRRAAGEASSLIGEALVRLEDAAVVLHNAVLRTDPEVLAQYLEKHQAAIQRVGGKT